MNKNIKEIFDSYPSEVKTQLLIIRTLIFEVANEEELGSITENLKWNQPSYSSKKGSPIRIDWSQKTPDQVSIFFNCNTTLIETFKELHKDTFTFAGNREVIIPLSSSIPTLELKQCLSMALRYHSIKKLPLLGA